MVSNTIPRSGIDADARWGFARTKGWMFGYKMHMCCSTGKLVVPLSAGITTANIPDNMIHQKLVGPLPESVRYVVADLGYHNHKLYDYSRQHGIQLVCPIRRFRHTRGIRLKVISFYKSRRGRRIYRNRSVSIEPLFQCVKDTFGVSVLPVRGFANTSSHVLMCVLAYQLAVYWNCMMNNNNPRCIKHMLGN